MPAYKLLFTAPFDFDTRVLDSYHERGYFMMDSVEEAEVWVCDPKARYVIGEKLLDYYPALRLIATPSTGTNHIDLEACKKRGVKVLSLLDDRAGLDTISASSEFTFKLLLDALRLPPSRELQGLTVGLLGFGRIGKRMAKYLFAFGAHPIANDPHQKSGTSYPLKRMFKDCDAVVVCCTLNDETRGLVTGELIRSMKEGAALVNTARGEIVDEDALVEVMKERPDLRVALDVLVGETTGAQQPARLQDLGAIVTPHIAGETFDSRTKAAKIILGLIEREAATWGAK